MNHLSDLEHTVYVNGLDHKDTEAKKQLEMLTQTKTYKFECVRIKTFTLTTAI